MAGAGNQATALLTDRASVIELWSKTKGGSSQEAPPRRVSKMGTKWEQLLPNELTGELAHRF